MGAIRRNAIAITVAAVLTAPLVAGNAVGAQDDPNAEINQAVGRFLLENGYGFDDPGKIRADLDAATTNVAGTTEPYDNFTNGPTDFAAEDIEPQNTLIIFADPADQLRGGPLVERSFRLDTEPIDAPPFTPQGWNDAIAGTIDQPTTDSLVDYGLGVPGSEAELRADGPPDPSTWPNYDQLTPETQDNLGESIDQFWPFSPNQPRGWGLEQFYGPESPLGCGEHSAEGYTVFCDSSDPGGSQFESGSTYVSVELPAPIDSMGPPYGIEVVFTFDDGTTAVYQGSFEGDFFNGSNHNYVLRFDNGLQFEHLAYDGASWLPQPTTARMVNDGNVITLVLDDSIDPASVRISTFKTDGSRQQGRVASYSLPRPDQPLASFPPSVIEPTPSTTAPIDLGDPSLYQNPDSVFVAAEPTATTAPEPTAVVEEEPTEVPEGTETPEGPATTSTDGDSSSNTTSIVLTLVGGTALVGGGVYFWRRNQGDPAITVPPVYTQTYPVTETLVPTPPISETGVPDPGQPSENLEGYLLVGDHATPDDTYLPPVTENVEVAPFTQTGDSPRIRYDYDFDEFNWEPIEMGDVDAHLAEAGWLIVNDAPAVVEADTEDTPETPTSSQPAENPFAPATGQGSWHRNNRAQQLFDETGEWVDPSTIALPQLVQRAFDEAPEPPKVITPRMAAARQGMYAGAATAGLQLPGKAFLTDSYDGPTGEPHMFWTLRVGPDGTILDTWAHAEKGGPAATAICRLEVYQIEPGVWWAFVKLIDTRTMRIFVANNPHSANPDGPPPRPETPEEAMRLALTGLVSDGKFIQSMDPRLER